jgi:aryl-alcohol dehydrogenase-like predicted oxidoreductase
MRHSWFAPLGRDLSRVVLGTADFDRAPVDGSLELLDAWLELGGNVIDTARHYGNAEAVVGRWLRERSCRDEVVIATKGGHHDMRTGESRVRPEVIDAELAASLEQLEVDSVDLYWLHRDDPSQSPGPVLETLDRHRQEGRIRVFGASNWTPERLDEARAYAEAHGLESFACSSPQLSLAVPREEPWPGCVGIHEPEARVWYERTQLPVVAWSSQAGGFFAGVRTEHVERVYVDEANLERLRRAEELAARKGCSATQVALAWVLHQPFPTYAVVGPRTVAELRECAAAAELELTPDECAWLDLTPAG